MILPLTQFKTVAKFWQNNKKYRHCNLLQKIELSFSYFSIQTFTHRSLKRNFGHIKMVSLKNGNAEGFTAMSIIHLFALPDFL